MLRTAEQMIERGARVPAAMCLRVAVEVNLRQVVFSRGLGRSRVIGHSLRVLKEAGVIDKRTYRAIFKVVRPGNQAAHGKLSPDVDLPKYLQRIRYLCRYLDALVTPEAQPREVQPVA